MGSSRVHTAYSWISLGCRSFFMIWASLRKSSGSMVPVQGIQEGYEWGNVTTGGQVLLIKMRFHMMLNYFLQREHTWENNTSTAVTALPGLRVFTATDVVSFQRPSNTSPNWPAPSFLSSLMDLRSISHWSAVLYDRPWVWGASIYRKRRAFFPLIQETMSDGWGGRSQVFSSPSCMVPPDSYTDHQPVWSNVPLAPSRLKMFCSSTRSSVRCPSSSAYNAWPSHHPALKERTQSHDTHKTQTGILFSRIIDGT